METKRLLAMVMDWKRLSRLAEAPEVIAECHAQALAALTLLAAERDRHHLQIFSRVE